MRRFLYDTNVFVYATGLPSRYRDPCRAILARQTAAELAGEATVDLLHELVHQRLRQTGDRAEAARRAAEVADLCPLHAVRPEDAPLALQLWTDHPRLDARDAFFAAVALNLGITAILTVDQAYDAIPGLERVDPLDAPAVDALA